MHAIRSDAILTITFLSLCGSASAQMPKELAILVKRSIVSVDYASLSGNLGVAPKTEQIARVRALAARLAKAL